MRPRSYLDHNATSPLRPEARAAMLAAFECIGNPSSVHAEGRAARNCIEEAREQIAHAFGAKPSEVYFCSGGTEAANWLLFHPQGSLYINPTEHKCVLEGHRFEPYEMRQFKVDSNGVVDLELVRTALLFRGPKVFAVQAANNETGLVQPIDSIASLKAQDREALVVCDAVQFPGRWPLNALANVDAFFISAHKFGGPKGIGTAVVRNEHWILEAMIRGGGQERRRRSGTENLTGAVGMAAALEAAVRDQPEFSARAKVWQRELEGSIRAVAPDAVIFGEGAERLPNTTSFAIPGKSAETALIAFDLEGVAVSSGSACSSGKVEGSHVLAAMGVPEDLSRAAIRVSTGWTTTDADIERFLTVFSRIFSSRAARHGICLSPKAGRAVQDI
jgi:cysteine desulfurase